MAVGGMAGATGAVISGNDPFAAFGIGAAVAAVAYRFNHEARDYPPAYKVIKDWIYENLYDSTSISGSFLFADLSYDLNSKAEGWFPGTGSTIFSDNLIGIGGHLNFNYHYRFEAFPNFQLDFGAGKYYGLSLNPHNGTLSLNYGTGINVIKLVTGWPVGISVPLDNIR